MPASTSSDEKNKLFSIRGNATLLLYVSINISRVLYNTIMALCCCTRLSSFIRTGPETRKNGGRGTGSVFVRFTFYYSVRLRGSAVLGQLFNLRRARCIYIRVRVSHKRVESGRL